MPPKDRTEQMRQRLADKAASRTKPEGPALAASMPGPDLKLLGGKSVAWFLWALTAGLLVTGLAFGNCLPLCVGSILHTAYFAIFSTTDIPFQLRVIYSVFGGLGAFVTVVRIMIYLPLLLNVVVDLAVDYNLLARLLYCAPSNRPKNPEPITLSFLRRVLMEPPCASLLQLSSRVSKGAPAASNDFDYATSRAERRKK